MSRSSSIRENDVRALLGVVRRVASLPQEAGQREAAVLEEVRRLLGAPFALVSFSEGFAPHRLPVESIVTQAAGLDDRQLELTAEYFRTDGAADPVHPRLADMLQQAAQGEVLTVSRTELFADAVWYRDRHVQTWRREADLDHCLFANFKLDDQGAVRVLALHRPWGDRPFTERDRLLADVLWAGVAPLVLADPRAPTGLEAALNRWALTPREREVSRYAVRGLANKEIARELGIAPDTVKVLLGRVYRKTATRGRTELASLLLGGDGAPRR